MWIGKGVKLLAEVRRDGTPARRRAIYVLAIREEALDSDTQQLRCFAPVGSTVMHLKGDGTYYRALKKNVFCAVEGHWDGATTVIQSMCRRLDTKSL